MEIIRRIFGVRKETVSWLNKSPLHDDGTNAYDFVVLGIVTEGEIESLAFDWITGNIYAGTEKGYILVCGTIRTGNFICVTVLSNQGKQIEGISLHPGTG